VYEDFPKRSNIDTCFRFFGFVDDDDDEDDDGDEDDDDEDVLRSEDSGGLFSHSGSGNDDLDRGRSTTTNG
jgi:hypothetical protein